MREFGLVIALFIGALVVMLVRMLLVMSLVVMLVQVMFLFTLTFTTADVFSALLSFLLFFLTWCSQWYWGRGDTRAAAKLSFVFITLFQLLNSLLFFSNRRCGRHGERARGAARSG